MDWSIREILVYGKANGELKRVTLERGVNIITGESRTGKSALIPIIDYCLGAGQCEIPVGVIRDFASWYAVHLRTPEGEIFVARREPGSARTSSAMYLIFGQRILAPNLSEITRNTDRDTVVADLSRRLGMTTQQLVAGQLAVPFAEPPNIRAIMPFLFQPQNIIANKDILFYKTDDPQHRERLKRIFPYVLGAVTEQQVILRNSLDEARRRLRQAERALDARHALLEDTRRASELLGAARALGLTTDMPRNPTSEELRLHLTAVLAAAESRADREILVDSTGDRQASLEAQIRDTRERLATLRRQLRDAQELATESGRLSDALEVQHGRLRSIDLIPEGRERINRCPVCQQDLSGHVPSVERIRAVRDRVRAELGDLNAGRPALDPVIQQMRNEIAEGRALLSRLDGELAEIRESQRETEHRDAEWEQRQRLVGRISFFLDATLLPSGGISDEEQRVRDGSALVAQLEEEAAIDDWMDRRDTALAAISLHMRTLAQRLDLERAEAALRLDINRLTVVRDAPSGRPEHLNEIGGGENWVGYHLCALLSLHMFFIEHQRPIPSILVLDQPSQIYFPVQGASEASNLQGGGDPTDWVAVRRVYELLFRVVRDLDSHLQIIAMDHADFRKDFPEFAGAVRARWRDGQKFI